MSISTESAQTLDDLSRVFLVEKVNREKTVMRRHVERRGFASGKKV